MRHAKLTINSITGLVCFVISFFIVLFPLGGLLDYLAEISNSFLNRTGLAFADGEADPSFLWILMLLMILVTGLLLFMVRVVRKYK